MGRCRNLGKNLAKYGVKIKRKRIEKLQKRKGCRCDISGRADNHETLNVAVDEADMLPEDTIIQPVTDPLEKQIPFSNERKLRKNELPLMRKKSCIQQKTKGNKTDVVSAKQMSKKKARKLLKAMRRNEQSIRKLENKMDIQ